ncbi:MAG: ATP-binding protein [Thiohalospira sp.]
MGLIQGRIAELEAELEEAGRAHDRLRLLERLVREADRRFREAHQPDVLRRASAYLADVTGGRYTQLLMEEGGGDGGLLVRDAGGTLRGVDGEAAELSRGTRDQVFLALRLAVADHLDAGHERLPLLLDEVFVHWDAERQEAGLRGLQRMAGDRQLVLFTCHREFGARMASLLGTEPLPLPGPTAEV